MSRARLVDTRVPPDPEGVVLVLHGGASRGESAMVSPTQLSVLRMVPVARRIARAGQGRLAVLRLLNSHRGWDSSTTPVMDVAWALEQVAQRFGDVPVALVGHSLGGRAALLAADRPGVTCAVALNPWLYPTDDVDLRGRSVLFVHGTDDRVASPKHSATVADRLTRTARVGYIAVPGGKHAMLRHGARFERYAAEFVAAVLLGIRPRSGPIWDVLAGEAFVIN